MRHERALRPWLASAWLLAGCNIDTLLGEFHVVETTGGSTTGGGSTGETGGSSSTDESSSSSSASASHDEGETTGTADSSGAHTSTGETTASSSTGPPSAVCGDANVEGEEECDDTNAVDDDECDNACARAYTLFVTSEFGYTGKLNGLKGADIRCRNRAALAELPRWDRYMALLSDSTTDAADRLHHAPGYYRLVNGLPVAHGWDALMNEPLEHPLNVTELSTTLDISVWTGTRAGGTAIPGAEHCGDWTIEADDILGHFGSSSEVGPRWLVWDNPKVNPTVCFDNRALYCVEQP